MGSRFNLDTSDSSRGKMAAEALNVAVQNGSIEKVKQLLDEGAEINSKVDTGGWTALHCAVQNKKEEIAHLLLDRGADPHVRKDNGATPFIVAGIVGSVELLELFLSKGSDINEHDVNGFTAFMEAAWYGKEEALRFLHSRGADVNLGRAVDEEKRALNKGGGTALMDAARNGHIAIVQTLIKEMDADVHICDNQGRNALIHALTEVKKWDQDKEALALFLLKHGTDVNKRDEYGKTALILAAERQSHTLVKAIAEKDGVDINATDNIHKTALSFAVENKNHEIARILCELGARTDIEEQNLIARARKRYDCEMVALLQQFGAKAVSSQPQTRETLPSRRWESKLQQLCHGNCVDVGRFLKINKINNSFRIQETSQGGVYLGLYNGEPVAVKVFRSETENAKREKACLEKCRTSKHLVRFYGWEEQKARLYLCLNLCEQNLEEYLGVTEENATMKSEDILERVFRAVQELHVFGFGHQDLHPRNILIDAADNIFLADFDECRKLVDDDDTDTIKEDLKALERLVVYVATRGKACFEKLPLQCPVDVSDYMELEDLRASLSSFNESIPVNKQLRHLMYHPYFWSRQVKYRFLRDVGNESDIKTRNTKHHNEASVLLKALNCDDDRFQSWMEKIHEEVLTCMEDPFNERDKKKKNRPKKNYENCASDLLKLIRHVAEHIKEKGKEVQEIIKEPEDYFLTLFPDLPIYVYQKLRNTPYKKHFPYDQNRSF